jgi:predicted transcriptional regulator
MLAVRLSDALEYELKHFTKLAHKTKTDVVKEALTLFFSTQALKEKKTSYELGQEVFGRYGSEKGDLSFTYKEKLKQKIREKNHTHR